MEGRLAGFITQRAGLLEEAGIEQAKSEVELILCCLLKVDRLHLYLEGEDRIDETVVERVDDIVRLRRTRYPLQYILEAGWFYGREFYVNPDVMAPTPETERLCELALSFCRDRRLQTPRILDLGVGSGVISVTMACELDDCRVLAVDLSEGALKVARKNARDMDVADKIEFRQSDFFASIGDTERFDLILSNPPYIAEPDYPDLPPEVLADPKLAMTAGEDGLDAIRVIVREAPAYLASGGRIMFEIGYDQAAAVARLTESDDRYQSINIIKDLNDIERVVILGCQEQ